MKLMIIHGPNLNFLGIREQQIYGSLNYEELCEWIQAKFPEEKIDCLQSNQEGEIIDFLQRAHLEDYDGVILNAGAYTHTSIAIYDAIRSIKPEVIEVHLSNIYAREAFRHHSYLAPACLGQISGLGKEGYIYAVHHFKTRL